MKNIREFKKTTRPVRVIQFGEGGFLRGFVDWMLQKMNEKGIFDGSVAVVQPIEKGMCDLLTEQNCLYTHIIRGAEGMEKTVVDEHTGSTVRLLSEEGRTLEIARLVGGADEGDSGRTHAQNMLQAANKLKKQRFEEYRPFPLRFWTEEHPQYLNLLPFRWER